MNFHARASLQHQSYSNSWAAAESGHDLRFWHERASPDGPLAVPHRRRLLREQIGQVIRARTANFINLPSQHDRAYP